MNTEDLKKLLKENGVHYYSYWGKNKLLDLANINKLIPESKPEPEQETDTQPEDAINNNRKRLRKIRNSPISVKLIDIETKEEKTFPSIYKASQ